MGQKFSLNLCEEWQQYLLNTWYQWRNDPSLWFGYDLVRLLQWFPKAFSFLSATTEDSVQRIVTLGCAARTVSAMFVLGQRFPIPHIGS